MGARRLEAWAPWCAAFLILIVTFSVLHLSTPHSPAKRDCSTCKVLSAPALADLAGILSLPVPLSSATVAILADQPVSAILLCLKPLRAPPAPATI